MLSAGLYLDLASIQLSLSPDDMLELSTTGLDSPGPPISLDSALALSRSSAICTLHNGPLYNLVTQYRQLSLAHSTLAQ